MTPVADRISEAICEKPRTLVPRPLAFRRCEASLGVKSSLRTTVCSKGTQSRHGTDRLCSQLIMQARSFIDPDGWMMAEAAQAVEPSAPEPGKPMAYDAFLSYAHVDRQVTVAIQKGLHRIARRLGQRRALRVFRDDTNLTAGDDLGSKITEALDSSKFMIVVLTPHAAASRWVNKEVAHWLEQRGTKQLMLVLAEGQLEWNPEDKQFDRDRSSAAPPALTAPGSLPREPLFIDVSGDEPWDLRSSAFRDTLTSLAAPIHGKEKDELAGDDLREQKRSQRLRRAAIAGLALLTVIAISAAGIAFTQRQEAIRQRNQAVASKLTSQGQAMLTGDEDGGDIRAIQQILTAGRIAPASNLNALLTAVVTRQSTIKIVPSPQATLKAVSPDGHRIATQSDDHQLHVWDAETGRPIGAPMKGHNFDENCVAFSADGRRIVSAGGDSSGGRPLEVLHVWDADTGRQIGSPITGHFGNVNGVAFSPDGHRIASATSDGVLRIWDADTDKPITHTDETSIGVFAANSVAFSPDGHRIVSANDDGVLRIWDADTGRQIGAPLTGHTSEVRSAAFSPDGRRIVSGSVDMTVRLWDADTGRQIGAPMSGHSEAVQSVAFSPDGHRIVSGSGYDNPNSSVGVLSVDNTVRLWDADAGRQIGAPLSGHSQTVRSVAFSPDGQRILSRSADETVRVWDADSRPMFVQLNTDAGPVSRVAFSPDGHRIVSGNEDGSVVISDVGSSQPVGAPITGHDGAVAAVVFSPNGLRIASRGTETATVWDATTGSLLGAPLNIPGITCMAFSTDGHRIVFGDGPHETVRIWDVDSGKPIGALLTGHISTVFSVAFSPDGRRIVSGSGDGTLRIWDADTGRQIGAPLSGHSAPVRSVAFSPDGHRVVSGSMVNDDTVRLWNADTGRQIGAPLRGHAKSVTSVAFSSDGHLIVSGGEDGTVRIWDADTGRPVGSPLTGPTHESSVPTDEVTSVAISPDNYRIASAIGYPDDTVRLWPGPAAWLDLLCNKLTANMSHKQWRDWVSPDIDYITVCPRLPIAPD
jgi:WD40 repeat protein